MIKLGISRDIGGAESLGNVAGIASNPLGHEDGEPHLQEVRDLSAVLAVTVAHSKVVPEVAVVHVGYENEGILVDFVWVVRNHPYSRGKRILRYYVALDEPGLGFFPRGSWCRLSFVVKAANLFVRRAQIFHRVLILLSGRVLFVGGEARRRRLRALRREREILLGLQLLDGHVLGQVGSVGH